MRHLPFRVFNGQTREERRRTVLGSCSGDASCRPANLTGLLLLLLLLLLLRLNCHPMAVVLTQVQTKQIRINIHKRNNTKNCTMTNKYTQSFHKLSHCYMFRHYRVILRQLLNFWRRNYFFKF